MSFGLFASLSGLRPVTFGLHFVLWPSACSLGFVSFPFSLLLPTKEVTRPVLVTGDEKRSFCVRYPLLLLFLKGLEDQRKGEMFIFFCEVRNFQNLNHQKTDYNSTCLAYWNSMVPIMTLLDLRVRVRLKSIFWIIRPKSKISYGTLWSIHDFARSTWASREPNPA